MERTLKEELEHMDEWLEIRELFEEEEWTKSVCLKDLKELEASFYNKGAISERCSSSFITLIPKNKDPVGLKDYRTINLIGVISKTISKILANQLKKEKKKAFLLKIDFEKAYDNVNWKFLLDIMGQMGFPSLWYKWVEGVLVSARSSVLVNGSPTFEFSCPKRIRQGDPLSV
ncbi:uncharacterized protein LOC110942874 [Helianthus annuus]|uniref:uncharacterized protein LOC110942874 n=1 Tax=Helianthus annuus TaxID=4232 RepID=UPI000B8FA7D5|nr:uncharacterized protein LOC110942874 [Helianthus annuus]